jgi:hypothetical protein
MIEKLQLLQLGIHINSNKAHNWGNYAFPNLPEKITTERPATQFGQESTAEMTESDIAILAETSGYRASAISDQIANLTTPGISNSIALQLTLFILFQVLGIQEFLVVKPLLEEQQLQPF